MKNSARRHFCAAGLALAAAALWAAPAAAQTCIDYTKLGMSGCKGEQQNAAISATEPPADAELLPPRKSLDEVATNTAPPSPPPIEQRIDDFLENYDKPPREFVAFSLEPTLENAVAWAQKYNDMMDRNQRLALAWNQAQQVLKSAQELGIDIPPPPSDLAPVPDFSPLLNGPRASQIGMGAVAGVQGGRQPDNPLRRVTPLQDGRIAGAQPVATGKPSATTGREAATGSRPIKVSYYFSAECPYCARFEPQFQQVIAELGPRLDVTCVDMTPSGQQAENIYGKVDCSWRPLMPGEKDAFGIESTPTLIVSRAADGDLERITGYVAAGDLRNFFLGRETNDGR